MEKQVIRDFAGRTLATYEPQTKGDIVVRDFNGRILGKYDSQCNVTRDFYGTILAKGNCVGMLVPPGEQ